MKKIHQTKNAPAPIGPYAQAVEANGFVFLSGQIPIDPFTNQVLTGPVSDQALRVMENIKAVLTAASLSFADVVQTTIFLVDMNDFGKVNDVYSKYFPEQTAARSTIQVAALPKGVSVEIEMTAVRS